MIENTFFLAGVLVMALNACDEPSLNRIRKPAVAGQFYSANPEKLRAEIKRYVAGGAALKATPRILISPHAGYVFSGPVAGKGFAAIDPATRRVILIGPSHRQFFEGISIPDVDGYQTPLGVAPLDKLGVGALRASGLVRSEPRAHAEEHCLEVQIPFLQVVLDTFSIIPILVGKADPDAIAELLLPLLDRQTMVVASSDFSHYLSHDEAKSRDALSVKTILDGRDTGPIDACGEIPIRIVIALAKSLNLSPVLLDSRTSYETAPQYGSNARVVGYASLAYTPRTSQSGFDAALRESGEDAIDSVALSDAGKDAALTLARRALEKAVRGELAPAVEPESMPPRLRESFGCFVTLKAGDSLRGCIGYLEPKKALYEAIIENACSAALSDPRFSPVSAEELAKITIEISVLTRPEPLVVSSPEALLETLIAGRDGLILRKNFKQATFLPQVWEQLRSKTSFLEHLAMKAGLGRDGWKNAEYLRYRAIHFAEK